MLTGVLQALPPATKILVIKAVLEVGAVLDISHMFSVRWEQLSKARLSHKKKLKFEAVDAAAAAKQEAEYALTVRCTLLF